MNFVATSARVRRRAGRMNERGSRSKVAGSRRITGFISGENPVFTVYYSAHSAVLVPIDMVQRAICIAKQGEVRSYLGESYLVRPCQCRCIRVEIESMMIVSLQKS